jgi:choline dehydrogenase
MTKNVDSFDFVVVGAGAAGCIIAARLAEDPAVTVCLLEAGPLDRNIWIHVPAGFTRTLFNPNITWQFKTEPTVNTGGRPIAVTQGRVVGGSGSINGLMYNRGQRQDFDLWAAQGNPGWSFDQVLPYFKRSERRITDGISPLRGRSGPIPVTDMDWIHPISEAFIQGAIESGIPRNPDYNGGNQAGVGYFQRMIERGLRVSSAKAFLRPGARHRNLHLVTNARATTLVFEGNKTVGVRYARRRGGDEIEVHARREVIVACGPVNTPRLLQISGIGPGELTRSLGAPIVADSPGVGANLKDHYSVRVVMRSADRVQTLNQLVRGPQLLAQIARWVTGKPSILAVSPSMVYVFGNSSLNSGPPDLQCVFTPGSYQEGRHYMLDRYPGVTAGVWQHRPRSRGFVRAVSRDPWIDPLIQPNYLSDPLDQQVLVDGIRFVRRLLNSPRMSSYVQVETIPGPEFVTDEALLEFARQNGSTGYHLVGTARMGPAGDPFAVVDDKLRVKGVLNLRVVDSSVMPDIPSANTFAASMMIAEKAADLLKTGTPHRGLCLDTQ